VSPLFLIFKLASSSSQPFISIVNPTSIQMLKRTHSILFVVILTMCSSTTVYKTIIKYSSPPTPRWSGKKLTKRRRTHCVTDSSGPVKPRLQFGRIAVGTRCSLSLSQLAVTSLIVDHWCFAMHHLSFEVLKSGVMHLRTQQAVVSYLMPSVLLLVTGWLRAQVLHSAVNEAMDYVES
jgi:hypothetical protein